MSRKKPPCTAITRAGRPCRGHVVPGSDPPLCYVHGGRRHPSSPDMLVSDSPCPAAHASFPGDADLPAQIAAVHQVTQQLLRRLQQEMDPAEYRRLASLVFTGANTIARLLRAQQALSRDEANGFTDLMAEALDGLGRKIGKEL